MFDAYRRVIESQVPTLLTSVLADDSSEQINIGEDHPRSSVTWAGSFVRHGCVVSDSDRTHEGWTPLSCNNLHFFAAIGHSLGPVGNRGSSAIASGQGGASAEKIEAKVRREMSLRISMKVRPASSKRWPLVLLGFFRILVHAASSMLVIVSYQTILDIYTDIRRDLDAMHRPFLLASCSLILRGAGTFAEFFLPVPRANGRH